MKWKHLPIVAFDTETTGLDPFAGDRVIEVGCVVLKLDASGQVVDRQDHSWLINPGVPIPRKTTELTGLRDADVANEPSFDHIASEIGALFASSVAVAHNAPFDLGFLAMEFRRAGLPWREPLAVIDTLDLSNKHFPKERTHKLADFARRLDVPLDRAHRATDDAAACGLGFAALARRHEVPDDLQSLLSWGDAVGRPPEDGPLGVDTHGTPTFTEGPHAGERVVDHPVHLAWMARARVQGPQGWAYRWPESTRAWIDRWLKVRCTGRFSQHAKSFRSDDWVLDACIADERQRAS